jgi:hypothetical protein
VELEGATHMTFVGQFRKPGHQSMRFQCAKLEAVAFWDAYLKTILRRRRIWRRTRWRISAKARRVWI